MQKARQVSVNKKKLSERLSKYRITFVHMAYRIGLTSEEIADIFGTTKQNVSLILKKEI